MLRSMYSGISGLKNFQTKLDVIGNNIANVNTHGFKKGRVIFKDLMSQTAGSASGSTGATGGVNAKQVGLGSTLAAIDTIHGSGSRQNTGRTLDIAIEGDGFFVVGGRAGDDQEEPVIGGFDNIKYTRAGNFYMDNEGFLVNADGYYLIGLNGDAGDVPEGAPEGDDIIGHQPIGKDENGDPLVPDDDSVYNPEDPLAPTVDQGGRIYIPADAQSMSIGLDGRVTYVDKEGALQFAGQLVMAKFPNAEGLTKDGNNYYQPSANSGAPGFSAGSLNGIGKAVSGALEMSNVDLSEEFTEMIVAQRGFQANTRIITTSDEILQELVNLKR
ncbi:flagellar hook-basal body complex protein [Solibacillus sp. CAU 1738]|uniref:flagellar hook-basal body complex protein n=1 Tax=Solibacillus sp. CAU 1738 TaxID=3140363 RepID=UPI003260734E